MSKNRQGRPTQDDVDRVNAALRRLEENSDRVYCEATEFKHDELTPEEEEFVRREGLNALNYIPQKILQEQSEAFQKYEEKMRKRAEIMSRPKTDPERIQIERKERAQNLRKSLDDRFNGFGYGMFLLVSFILTVPIIDRYGWRMGIFSGLLMLAILELSYRLYAHH